jgi:hypothetical protein
MVERQRHKEKRGGDSRRVSRTQEKQFHFE